MKIKIFTIFCGLATLLTSCVDDILDRPQLNKFDGDNTLWLTEVNVRNYATEYYPVFFRGYNHTFGTEGAAYLGYTFNDDVVTNGVQTSFLTNIPNTLGSNKLPNTPPEWIGQYTGPTWYFGWVRKSNILIENVQTRMKNILSDEASKHWIGIGRFFRAVEYAKLVNVFENVPYYQKPLLETDIEELYKPRTPRNEVMDSVYTDFMFALENIRSNDGFNFVNKHVVAGSMARAMLIEASWQKYHYKNDARAKQFYQYAINACEILMKSGNYDIVSDFRSLFGSEDLKGNRDVIFYKHYDLALNVTHFVATNSNLIENQSAGANLSVVKSFICNDGKPWKLSTVQHADSFNIANLVKTRDPRFEATFYNKATVKSLNTALYQQKFISRAGASFEGVNVPSSFLSSNNSNDYPLIRYAEILLIWIEAKAELGTVTQADIDASINKIRNRPLDAVAVTRGVQKTAPMILASLPDDPDRDKDVSPLLWEIRRERRMELLFEHSRIIDLRRWKKLHYMNGKTNPDVLRGIWVNVKKELPNILVKAQEKVLSVVKADGTRVIYDGTNGDQLVGYFNPTNIQNRQDFENVAGVNTYLHPLGKVEIENYKAKGFVLEQTSGW